MRDLWGKIRELSLAEIGSSPPLIALLKSEVLKKVLWKRRFRSEREYYQPESFVRNIR